MKRKIGNIMQLSILAALGLSVILSIFITEISWPDDNGNRLEISVIFREWNNSSWGEIRLGMEKAASDYEAELRFLTPQQANSADQQQKLIEQEIKNGADGLVIIPAGEEVQQYLAENKPGIPFIIMESENDQTNKNTSSCTPDNAKIGALLAQAAAADYQPGSLALLVDSYPDNSGIQKRLQSACDELEKAGLSAVTPKTDAEWEKQLPEADCIIVPDGSTTSRILAMLEEDELDISLYTAGYCQEIITGLEKGIIEGAVIWNGYGEGYLAIQNIADKLLKQKTDPAELAVILVRKEDMYEPESQKILFPIGN